MDDYATPAGLELLTTVHWVVTREQAVTIDQAIEKVNSWNDRKSRMFSQDQITEACDVLAAKDWLPSFGLQGIMSKSHLFLQVGLRRENSTRRRHWYSSSSRSSLVRIVS